MKSKKIPVSLMIVIAILSWTALVSWFNYYHDPRPVCKVARWNKRIVEYKDGAKFLNTSRINETRKFVVESENRSGFDYLAYLRAHPEDIAYIASNSDPEKPNRLVIFTNYSHLDKNFLRTNNPAKKEKNQ